MLRLALIALSIEDLNTSIETITAWPVQFRALTGRIFFAVGDKVQLFFLNKDLNHHQMKVKLMQHLPNTISSAEEPVAEVITEPEPVAENWGT